MTSIQRRNIITTRMLYTIIWKARAATLDFITFAVAVAQES